MPILARDGLGLPRELEDIIVADVALSFAFTMVLSGGLFGFSSSAGALLSLFAISLVAVTLSFVLHEMMHKLAAQHFGAAAAFRRSDNGLMITLFASLFGFLIGIPGATVIYTNNFTRREEGYVSLAGPLTNLVVFAVFFAVGLFAVKSISFAHGLFSVNSSGFVNNLISITLLISLVLAFFNMLPIYPLDGSKVLRWNKPVYFATLAAISALLLLFFSTSDILFSLIFMLVFAFAMNFFFRGGIRL
jgi:Zn-dependent protease